MDKLAKVERKNRSEVEFLKGKIRELEKRNRQLERIVGHLKKSEHLFYEAPIEQEEDEKKDSPLTCQECGKGKIEVLCLLDRVYHQCSLCDYRERKA